MNLAGLAFLIALQVGQSDKPFSRLEGGGNLTIRNFMVISCLNVDTERGVLEPNYANPQCWIDESHRHPRYSDLVPLVEPLQPEEGEIYPREIFAIVMHEAEPPKGWSLKWDLVFEWSGSVDYDEYIITASKGKDLRYFHISIRGGVESDTDQSVYEVKVKQVKTPNEDWTHNWYWDEGEWDGERGKSTHWVPSGYDPLVGVCSYDEVSTFPQTKAECFKSWRK